MLVLVALFLALGMVSVAGRAIAQQGGSGSGENQLPQCANSQAAGTASIAGGGAVTYNVPYVSGGGFEQQGDIYVPGGSGPFPAIVLLHGGGWTLGDKCWLSNQSVSIEQSGFVAFSINYRLAPKYCFPIQDEDAASAISYLRQNATKYKVDPARIGLLGTSAGGQIAAMTALRDGFGASGTQVAAIASWSGPFDMVKVMQERPNTEEIQTRERQAVCLSTTAPLTDPSTVSALEKASISDQKIPSDYPPTFIANATTEFIPLDQAQAFYQKLKGLGVPAEMITPPHGHATQYTKVAIQPTIDFFNQYVKNYKAPKSSPESPSPRPSPSSPQFSQTPPVAIGLPTANRSKTALVILIAIIAALIVVTTLLAQPAISAWRRSRARRT
jgi:acetyl esterase/lipase